MWVTMCTEAPLDLNAAWVIARDLRVGTAELRTCNACAVRYLVASASRLAPTCPLCSLHARNGRGSAPAEEGRPLLSQAGVVPTPY